MTDHLTQEQIELLRSKSFDDWNRVGLILENDVHALCAAALLVSDTRDGLRFYKRNDAGRVLLATIDTERAREREEALSSFANPECSYCRGRGHLIMHERNGAGGGSNVDRVCTCLAKRPASTPKEVGE